MPVTMREVAARAKVSVATVCKSLQNAPTIPLKTRNAVAKVAAEMGYRPHPYVSALMQARRQRAAPGRPPPLAFITAYETADAWKRQPTPFLTLVYAGAKERAEQRGYPLSHFWLHQDNMGNRRLSEVLHTRGVRGILLPPMPRPDKKIDLVWPYFSVVSVGAQLDRPVFHGTANDHYHSCNWPCRLAGAAVAEAQGSPWTSGSTSGSTGVGKRRSNSHASSTLSGGRYRHCSFRDGIPPRSHVGSNGKSLTS
jgi:LacI family transcriptional regulator